jgi:hypothetical protein
MGEIIVVAAAVIVGILSVARLTRLLTQDTFPPAVWFRMKWDDYTDESGWNTLLHCHWCLAPWLTLPIGLWGWLTDLQTAWWVFNGWLAAAYVASMVVERDEVE